MASDDSSNTPPGLAVGAMVRFASKLSGEFYRGIVYFHDTNDGSFGIDKVSRGVDIKSYDSAAGFFQFLVKDIKEFRVLVPATTPTATNTTKVDQKNNPANASSSNTKDEQKSSPSETTSSNIKDDHKKSSADDALVSNTKDEQKSSPSETTSSNIKDEQKRSLGLSEASSSNTKADQN